MCAYLIRQYVWSNCITCKVARTDVWPFTQKAFEKPKLLSPVASASPSKLDVCVLLAQTFRSRTRFIFFVFLYSKRCAAVCIEVCLPCAILLALVNIVRSLTLTVHRPTSSHSFYRNLHFPLRSAAASCSEQTGTFIEH